MKIYFLDKDNLQECNGILNDIYNSTIIRFEEKLVSYKNESFTEVNKSFTEVNKSKILFNELHFTIEQLKDEEFKKFYIKCALEILERIRYASISIHTDKCIIRAVFDILFKYCLDFEYKIPHLCCNNTRFKTLQFEILRDLRWKIIN